MKISSIARVITIALLAVGTEAAWAKVISFNDLPAPAQREAQTELKSGTLKRVESVDHQGKTIYALTFQRSDGTSKYIFLNPDGTYVHDQNLPMPGSTTSVTTPAGGANLQLSQVPQAVQRTIQTETRNGPVSRIVQLPHPPAVMYEVFFKLPNGQEKTIYLNPDGSYVKNTQVAGQGSHSWDTVGKGNSSQPLASGTQLSFSQLPPAVQNTLRTQAGASRIQNIQVAQVNGESVYQADIDRSGQRVQLRVTPAGNILSTRQSQSALGATQP